MTAEERARKFVRMVVYDSLTDDELANSQRGPEIARALAVSFRDLIEECAKICEGRSEAHTNTADHLTRLERQGIPAARAEFLRGAASEARNCAAAIRALVP